MRKFRNPLTLLALFLATSAACAAPPLADKIPSDALVYIGWKGADALPDAYAQSNLKGILDATDLPNQITAMIQSQMAKEPDAGKQAAGAAFKSLAGYAYHHPTAFYFGGIDFTTTGKPMPPVPHLALITDAGADAPAMFAEADKLVTVALADAKLKGNTNAPNMAVRQSGSLVIITIGTAPGVDALTGGPPVPAAANPAVQPLTTAPAFIAALVQGDADAAVTIYADTPSLLKLADDAAKQKDNGNSYDNWTKARDLLNLDGFTQILYTGNFHGPDFLEHFFIGLPSDKAKRSGLLTLLDEQPLSPHPLNMIPATATWGGTVRFDGKRLIEEIRAAAAKLGDQPARQFDGALQMATSVTGVDLEKDLFASLSDEWYYFATPVTVAAPARPGMPDLSNIQGLAIINHLKDAKHGQSALEGLEDFLNNAFATRAPDPANAPQFVVTQTNGLSVHTLKLPILAPSWAIDDKDNLIIALTPEALQVAADHLKTGGKSLADNPAIVDKFNQLKVENPSSFGFSDLTQTAPAMYAHLLRLLADHAAQKPDDPQLVLPAFEKIQPYFDAFVAVQYVDDAGYHNVVLSPFPGAVIFTGQEGIFATLADARRPRSRRRINPAPATSQPAQN